MKSILKSKFSVFVITNLIVISANAGLGFPAGEVDYRLSCKAQTQETKNPSLVDFIGAGGSWVGVGDDMHLLQFHITKYADSTTANVFLNVPLYDVVETQKFHTHFPEKSQAQIEAQKFSIYKKLQSLGTVSATSNPDSVENINESNISIDAGSGIEIQSLRIQQDTSDSKVLEIQLSAGNKNFALTTKCDITK